MKLVDLIGVHVEANTGAPIVLLREHDAPHRVLPIFIGGPEAAAIALALSGQEPPRPMTHDVMATLLTRLDAHLDAVEVTETRDGAFFAELTLAAPAGELRIDSRPSDAIALAVRLGTPVFVSDDVMDEAGTTIEEEVVVDDDGPLDPDAIEEMVEEFRGFLDEVTPTDFEPGDDEPGDSPDR